jgi:dUTP pyrophosphatase
MKSPENERVVVHFQRLRPDALLPKYQTDGAAGMDLVACPAEGAPVEIPAGEIRMIPTGWAAAIPNGYEGQVRPRSGLAAKHGVTVPNAPGTIDSDYRGELIVALINLGKQAFTIEPGMRIAQLVIAPVSRAAVVEVGLLPGTARGAGGFGSTGA